MGRVKLCSALAVLALAGTACGTTLPNSSFEAPTAAPTGQAAGNFGGGTGATTGPSAGGVIPGVNSTGIPGKNGTQGQTITTGPSGGSHGSGPQAGCGGTWSGPWVSGNNVKIGEIVSGPGNPFAPNQFIPSYYGALAYFGYLNSQGGLCGKTIQFIKCDDNGDRNQNVACAHRLIDQDHVFALVSTNVFQYAAASYVSSSGTPDFGGQPITPGVYMQCAHLYSITGSYYPNNNCSGSPPPPYWGLSGLGIFWKKQLHVSKVGLIYYAESDSQHGANYFRGWFTQQGVHVDDEEVPLAGDPSPQIQDMKNKGDQAVIDGLDIGGNSRVCQAMQNYNYNVPKVSTVSVWSNDFGPSLGQYNCSKNYYVWSMTTNYQDTSNPEIRTFQQAYNSFAPGAIESQWSLEGWAAAMWFSDGVKTCKGTISRACVESFVNTKTGYTGHGLLDPHTASYQHWKSKPSSFTQCYTIAKWSGGTNGSWQTVANHTNNCFTTGLFDYQ